MTLENHLSESRSLAQTNFLALEKEKFSSNSSLDKFMNVYNSMTNAAFYHIKAKSSL